MNIDKLLKKGYFAKELPPCFSSEKFGVIGEITLNSIKTIEEDEYLNIASDINSDNSIPGDEKREKIKEKRTIHKNKLRFSECTPFSIPKLGIARNIIKIPNPYHEGQLSEEITKNYPEIKKIFNMSKLTFSSPIMETDEKEGNRSIKHKSYSEFKELSILESFNYQYQLKTDISKFYSSIYTHTIPWVTYGGKEKYKKNWNLPGNDASRDNNIYGDDIDNRVMWSQNLQTKGIPIGPDTSLIIAEIIACHLDKLLQDQLKKKRINWLGYRYYDDYILCFKSEIDLQIALKELRSNLNEFELNINDLKTKISINSNELEKDWAIKIKSFLFRENEEDQKHDIWNFFSILFKFKDLYPNDSVTKFSLNKFNFVRIEKSNWAVFESLLFRLAITETSSLQKVAKILVTYKTLVSKVKLKDFCLEVIDRHYEKCHDYELSWSLWLISEFNIYIKKEVFEKIFISKSIMASILGLDLLKKNKRIKTFNYNLVTEYMKTENLNTKYWILVYESIFHNLIDGIDPSVLSDHLVFKELQSKNITFYDNSNTLAPLKLQKSSIFRVTRKMKQVKNQLNSFTVSNTEFIQPIEELAVDISKEKIATLSDREELKELFTSTDSKIDTVLDLITNAKSESVETIENRYYFTLTKRVQELRELVLREIDHQDKEDNDLLFNPGYGL